MFLQKIHKRIFLKKLPYIRAWPKDQKFISKLIKKSYLNRKDQDELTQYFDVTNEHWSKCSGESSFEIGILFSNPEMCGVFDKNLIKKARIKLVPRMSKFFIGDMEKNVKNYAKTDLEFNKLYEKRISEKTYFQRNYIYQTVFDKIVERIRIVLYRNKKIRDYLNRHYYYKQRSR